MSREKESAMELRCPDCASPEVTLIDRGTRLECGNCGAEFVREEAFVSVADAEAYAAEQCACTCDKVRGCPQCFQRADEMVGALDPRLLSALSGWSRMLTKRTAIPTIVRRPLLGVGPRGDGSESAAWIRSQRACRTREKGMRKWISFRFDLG